MSSFYRQQLEDYLKTLDIQANTVFDFGGAQKPVKGRTKSWDVKHYEVWDLPEFDLEITPPLFPETQADMIFMLEVLEYLTIPNVAFANIATFLAPGGRAIVTAPLCYPVHNEVELDSLRYTENGLRRLAENAHLSVVKVHYRYHKERNLSTLYAQDGMRMAKGVDHEITGYILELTK